MNDQNPVAHPPFPTAIAQRLLSLLSSDDTFREVFSTNPKEALLQAGMTQWQADAALAGRSCLFVQTLASKEEIASAKERLMQSLTSHSAHTVVFIFAEGGPQKSTEASRSSVAA